jgi:hypothetical protein
MRKNKEGLTYVEWLNAAGIARPAICTAEHASTVKAWWDGEDPTEYRASAQVSPVAG